MAQKNKRHPIFQSIPIKEEMDLEDLTVPPDVYVQSTHYTTNADGFLSSVSGLLAIPETELGTPQPSDYPIDNSLPGLKTDFSVYLSALNDLENNDLVEEPQAKKKCCVVSHLLCLVA